MPAMPLIATDSLGKRMKAVAVEREKIRQRERERMAQAQQKINLASPNQSRFYVRLAEEFHHCWVTPSSGGAPDCPGSSAAMLAAITAFANGIPVTPIDPNLVISNALTLKQGTVAAGGNRYEANLVAKYMFQTGSGTSTNMNANEVIAYIDQGGLTLPDRDYYLKDDDKLVQIRARYLVHVQKVLAQGGSVAL